MVHGIIIKLMKNKYSLSYLKILVVKFSNGYLSYLLYKSTFFDLYIKKSLYIKCKGVIFMTDSILEFIKTFFMLFFELLALFIVVSFIVSLIQQVISEEKIKKILSRPNKAVNYLLGTL